MPMAMLWGWSAMVERRGVGRSNWVPDWERCQGKDDVRVAVNCRGGGGHADATRLVAGAPVHLIPGHKARWTKEAS
jgi:hypothetical protein